MHITILEDGSQSECETLLTQSLTTAATEISFPSDIFVNSYNMMSFSAAECLADFKGVPGVISIVNATALVGPYAEFPKEVKTYLTEVEAFLRETQKLEVHP